MNRTFLLLSLIIALALTGCDNRQKIEGQWQSAPQKINVPQTSTSSASIAMAFGGDGNVTIAADIDITEPSAQQIGDSVVSYQTSVAATASMSGTWRYAPRHNDEVLIEYDINSFTLDIDPESVNFTQNILTGEQAPTVMSLRQQTVDKYKMMLSPFMKGYLASFAEIEDIEVDKGVLRCEVADRDYVFSAVPSPAASAPAE